MLGVQNVLSVLRREFFVKSGKGNQTEYEGELHFPYFLRQQYVTVGVEPEAGSISRSHDCRLGKPDTLNTIRVNLFVLI